MISGKVRCGFFQELVLHLQFPGFPLELAQSRALAHGWRRLFAGMLTAIGARPVTEGAFVDTELLSHSGNRARRLDHHLHSLIPEFGREALLRSRQLLTFPDVHPNGWTVRKPRGTPVASWRIRA